MLQEVGGSKQKGSAPFTPILRQQILSFPLCQGSPRPPSDSVIFQKDLQKSKKHLYSWLWLMMVRRYRLKSSKGKGPEGRVQRGSRSELPAACSQRSPMHSASFSWKQGVIICMKYPNEGCSRELGVRGFYWGQSYKHGVFSRLTLATQILASLNQYSMVRASL